MKAGGALPTPHRAAHTRRPRPPTTQGSVGLIRCLVLCGHRTRAKYTRISWAATPLHYMKREDLLEVRCPQCGKLLARGQAVEMQFKCARCKTYFTLRTQRPNPERPERPPERTC